MALIEISLFTAIIITLLFIFYEIFISRFIPLVIDDLIFFAIVILAWLGVLLSAYITNPWFWALIITGLIIFVEVRTNFLKKIFGRKK